MIDRNLQNQGWPLLRRVPPVLRGRGFRLYLQGGGRLLDLWQYGGAAVLGHTPSKVLRELKNTAARGLFAALPHPWENRFTKALSRLFPGKLYRIYGDEASLRQGLAEAGYTVQAASPFPDPALTKPADPPPAILSLWRPFLGDGESLSPPYSEGGTEHSAPQLILIPLLPWPLAPKVLVIPEDLASAPGFPPSDLLSPLILAGGTRSIYDLIAAAPERGNLHLPRIQQALLQSNWRRRGIYLYYSKPVDEESYAKLFLQFLEKGFLLPPGPHTPLILPDILSPGEEAALAELLQRDCYS